MRNLLREESNNNTTLLFAVVTINEASYHWGKHKTTVYRAIDRGHILARTGKYGFIIDVNSLNAHWGQPEIPLSYELNFP